MERRDLINAISEIDRRLEELERWRHHVLLAPELADVTVQFAGSRGGTFSLRFTKLPREVLSPWLSATKTLVDMETEQRVRELHKLTEELDGLRTRQNEGSPGAAADRPAPTQDQAGVLR